MRMNARVSLPKLIFARKSVHLMIFARLRQKVLPVVRIVKARMCGGHIDGSSKFESLFGDRTDGKTSLVEPPLVAFLDLVTLQNVTLNNSYYLQELICLKAHEKNETG